MTVNRFAALGLLAEALDGKLIAVVTQERAEVVPTLDGVLQSAATFVGEDEGVDALDLRVVRRNGLEAIRTQNGGTILFLSAGETRLRLSRIRLDAVYLQRYAHVHPDALTRLTVEGTEVVHA
ncbi:hypothetical protein ACEYYH_10540 [Microbacterium trichothecenolyticum]|uniref:hypothetical protein n=1 Tax=Microbacterium trichothecenolyticum TaxID=69370 RepID=UPI0035BE5C1F